MAILESMTAQEDLDERAAAATNDEEVKTIEVRDSDDEDLPTGAAGQHVRPAAATNMAANAAN